MLFCCLLCLYDILLIHYMIISYHFHKIADFAVGHCLPGGQAGALQHFEWTLARIGVLKDVCNVYNYRI